MHATPSHLHTGFQSDAGPWTVLAADALVEDEGTYRPDFSAHAGSEHFRCIRISKASFDTVTSLSRQEGVVPYSPDLGVSGGGDGDNRDGGGMNISVSRNGSNVSVSRHGKTPSDGGMLSSGSGTGGWQGRISPDKVRRGLPSGSSLKILQAVNGSSVSPRPDPRDTPVEASMGEGESKAPGSSVGAEGGEDRDETDDGSPRVG